MQESRTRDICAQNAMENGLCAFFRGRHDVIALGPAYIGKRENTVKPVLLLATIAFLAITSCSFDNTEDDHKLNEYDHDKSVIANMPYLFQRAYNVMGDDAKLFLISGIQKSGKASKEMNLDLYCYFSEGSRILEFDITNETITRLDSSPPLGQELLAEDEVTANRSIEYIWDLCVKDHGKEILNYRIYRPLVYPPLLSLNMYLFTKNGINFPQDFFCYDMNTGEQLSF